MTILSNFFAVRRLVQAAAGRTISVALVAFALSACAMPGSSSNDSEGVSYLHKRPVGSFVRIEKIEPGAPDNAHPFSVSETTLRQALTDIKVKGTVSSSPEPVFNNDELNEIVPPLVSALAKAGAKEDVTFAVMGGHGLFGSYARRLVITGRLFVREEQLNLIFGLVHEPPEKADSVAAPGRLALTPGTRARPIESGWNIVPGVVRLANNRPDWVLISPNAVVVVTPPPTGANAPAAVPSRGPSRVDEIEQKLGVIDNLKAKGLITEEEYREKRRAILQGI